MLRGHVLALLPKRGRSFLWARDTSTLDTLTESIHVYLQQFGTFGDPYSQPLIRKLDDFNNITYLFRTILAVYIKLDYHSVIIIATSLFSFKIEKDWHARSSLLKANLIPWECATFELKPHFGVAKQQQFTTALLLWLE